MCCICNSKDNDYLIPNGRAVSGLRWSDHPQLCVNCFAELQPKVKVTSITGIPAAGGMNSCANLVNLVTKMKYNNLRGLAWPLSELVLRAITVLEQNYGSVDCLVPVPMHWFRRYLRGFNQAEVITELAGLHTGTVVEKRLVSRKRNTGQQAKVSSLFEMRQKNVAGCFSVNKDSDGRTVGIVDDLVTSGTTVIELASELQKAGWEVSWIASAGIVVNKRHAGGLSNEHFGIE